MASLSFHNIAFFVSAPSLNISSFSVLWYSLQVLRLSRLAKKAFCTANVVATVGTLSPQMTIAQPESYSASSLDNTKPVVLSAILASCKRNRPYSTSSFVLAAFKRFSLPFFTSSRECRSSALHNCTSITFHADCRRNICKAAFFNATFGASFMSSLVSRWLAALPSFLGTQTTFPQWCQCKFSSLHFLLSPSQLQHLICALLLDALNYLTTRLVALLRKQCKLGYLDLFKMPCPLTFQEPNQSSTEKPALFSPMPWYILSRH